eukprot:TRINITY_DN16473_c0_g1_i1.p2 TRINITY_DN16473_c0_g1~~TRINITY_DN16473_c0_g1_i1.p2  ORF type:complete len:206 (-),score=49.92 TRINITY_DN16473_c0_g1_i1:319-936(-)
MVVEAVVASSVLKLGCVAGGGTATASSVLPVDLLASATPDVATAFYADAGGADAHNYSTSNAIDSLDQRVDDKYIHSDELKALEDEIRQNIIRARDLAVRHEVHASAPPEVAESGVDPGATLGFWLLDTMGLGKVGRAAVDFVESNFVCSLRGRCESCVGRRMENCASRGDGKKKAPNAPPGDLAEEADAVPAQVIKHQEQAEET